MNRVIRSAFASTMVFSFGVFLIGAILDYNNDILSIVDYTYPVTYILSQMPIGVISLAICSMGASLLFLKRKKTGLILSISGAVGFSYQMFSVVKTTSILTDYHTVTEMNTHLDKLTIVQLLHFFNAPFYEIMNFVSALCLGVSILSFLFMQNLSLTALKNTLIFTFASLTGFELGVMSFCSNTSTDPLAHFTESFPITNTELLAISVIGLMVITNDRFFSQFLSGRLKKTDNLDL